MNVLSSSLAKLGYDTEDAGIRFMECFEEYVQNNISCFVLDKLRQ
jgi:hypothetical protein